MMNMNYAKNNIRDVGRTDDFTDVTLVSEEATHSSLQMSSSRDLTDVSED